MTTTPLKCELQIYKTQYYLIQLHWHALRTLIRAIVYNFRKAEARATKVRQGVHGLRGGRRAAVARNRHGDFLVVQSEDATDCRSEEKVQIIQRTIPR